MQNDLCRKKMSKKITKIHKKRVKLKNLFDFKIWKISEHQNT